MRGLESAAWIALAVALASADAHAQPQPPAESPAASTAELDRARGLVEEGRRLGAGGDWRAALGKFRQAAQLAESPGLRFNIAIAEEQLGQLVAALTDYRLAKREAARGEASAMSADVDARIAALEPRIASFAFQRPSGSERATVFVDGVALGDARAGRVEVDPGPHRVTALLDGVTRFERIITVGDGESRTVPVALSPLPPPPRSPLPYVIGGLGVVSLGVMGVFIGLRQSAVSDLDAVCHDGHCPTSAQADIDRGRTYTGVAEVAALVGVVGLATGIILLARGPSRSAGHGQGRAPLVARITARPTVEVAF